MGPDDTFHQERLYHSAYLDGQSAVYKAIASGRDAKYLAALLNQSFIWKEEQLSYKDEVGRSPLMKALSLGVEDVVKVLFESEPDNLAEIVNQADNDGITPLHQCAKWGLSASADLVIPLVEDYNCQDSCGFTAAHNCSSSEEPPFTIDPATRTAGQNKILEALGGKGADYNLCTVEKHMSLNVLHIMLRNNNTEKLKFVLTQKADVNAVDQTGRTPLHYAVLNQDDEAIKLLITHGANLEVKEKLFGWTPFLAAANSECSQEALDLLKGPDQEQKELAWNGPEGECPPALRFEPARDGKVAIHYAAKEGSVDTIAFLHTLSEGYVSMQDKLGRTALHDAATSWKHEAIRELVTNCGADVNAVDNAGRTALHLACVGWEQDNFWPQFTMGEGVRDWIEAETNRLSNVHLETVKVLIELGADPNVADEDGNIALHFAARTGVTDVINHLIEKGGDENGPADVEIKNKDGKSPGDFAAANGHSLERTGLFITPRNKELPLVVQALEALRAQEQAAAAAKAAAAAAAQ